MDDNQLKLLSKSKNLEVKHRHDKTSKQNTCIIQQLHVTGIIMIVSTSTCMGVLTNGKLMPCGGGGGCVCLLSFPTICCIRRIVCTEYLLFLL